MTRPRRNCPAAVLSGIAIAVTFALAGCAFVNATPEEPARTEEQPADSSPARAAAEGEPSPGASGNAEAEVENTSQNRGGFMDGTEQAASSVSTDSLLTDIAANPAFNGSGKALLPWFGSREGGYTLAEESALLPYHSQVHPQEAADALNRLIDDYNKGNAVAFPVYSAEERAADPAKEAAVLFFFRGKEGAPFAIVNPGGGFSYVGALHESLPHALCLSEQGVNAFSLSYRGGSGQYAVEDLARAVQFIFEHSDELGVNPEGYSLWGSSAGARMAAAIGSYGTASFGAADLPKPAAVIMAYTGQGNFTPYDPPTYAVVGDLDGIAPASTMEARINGLMRAGVAAEIAIFPGLGHGFGTGQGTAAEGWIDAALQFWLDHR